MEKGGEDLNFPPKTNQSEAEKATDFPAAKKLARQLDFNSVGGSAQPPPLAAAATSVIFPEQTERPVVVQMQHPTPAPPQAKQSPVQQQQSRRPVKPESPKVRPRQNNEVKDGTPKKQKQCNCKHSRCLKLYCECFASGIYCDGCNCVNCHNNVENEPARRDAVETTLERNPNAFRPKIANSPRRNRDNRTNPVKASSPLSSWPSVPDARVANNASVGPSKYTYRSLLADLIRSDDMKELCALLVVYANEAARVLSDERNAKEKMTTMNNGETSLTSSLTSQLQGPKVSNVPKSMADETLIRVRAEKAGPDEWGSDGTDASKTRPMSPGTLALMCDEHDTVFVNSTSNGLGDRLAIGQAITEIYAEQEKTVLTTFRDCLNRLITFGELKETKCYSLARNDSGGQSQSQMEAVKSPTSNACWDPSINGFQRSTVVPTTQPSQNSDNQTHLKIPFHAENGEFKLKDA